MFRLREAAESVRDSSPVWALIPISPSPRAEAGVRRRIPARAGRSDVGVPMWGPPMARGPVAPSPGGTTRHSVPRAGDGAQNCGSQDGLAPLGPRPRNPASAARRLALPHHHRCRHGDATVISAPCGLLAPWTPGPLTSPVLLVHPRKTETSPISPTERGSRNAS